MAGAKFEVFVSPQTPAVGLMASLDEQQMAMAGSCRGVNARALRPLRERRPRRNSVSQPGHANAAHDDRMTPPIGEVSPAGVHETEQGSASSYGDLQDDASADEAGNQSFAAVFIALVVLDEEGARSALAEDEAVRFEKLMRRKIEREFVLTAPRFERIALAADAGPGAAPSPVLPRLRIEAVTSFTRAEYERTNQDILAPPVFAEAAAEEQLQRMITTPRTGVHDSGSTSSGCHMQCAVM
jgi:hypothetical protein